MASIVENRKYSSDNHLERCVCLKRARKITLSTAVNLHYGLQQLLAYHYFDVSCMAFSRDDRLLVSAGNYLDNTVVRRLRSAGCLLTHVQVVWDMSTGSIVAASQVESPV